MNKKPFALSQNLFVSKYQLQLPSEEVIRRYLQEIISDEDISAYKKQMSEN